MKTKTEVKIENVNPFSVYTVERPSVALRRCATQVVSRKGHVWQFLLTKEIATEFLLDG